MSWSQWVSCWLINTTLLLSSAACSGSKPQVVGETTKLKQGERASSDASLLDGKTLKLRGARGETLGIQVLIPRSGATTVSVELPANVATVSGFRVGYLTVSEPSTAMYGPSRGTGSYPDVLHPAGQRFDANGHAFFDIAISPSAPAGAHTGKLQIGDQTFSTELRVEPVTIDIRKDPLVWVFYLPKEIARVHRLPDLDNEALLKVERVYHELFREHGSYLAANMRPHRFPARREFARDVRYWPVSMDLTSEATITADVRSWLDYFKDSPITPFAIPIDEPRSAEQKARARWVAEVIERAGGGRPKLLRAVTDTAHPVYGRAMDLYLSPANIPAAARARAPKGERFWTYNGKPPQAGSMIVDTDGTALRTWGWIAYRYDVELWHAWEGLYYEDRYNRGGPTDVLRDPLTFDERSKGGTDHGNGDGLLAYPGPLPSLRLKALRRGLQDRALLMRLASCGRKSEADAIAARVVPRALGEASGSKPSWPREERSWERARHEILDALSRSCRDAA